MLAGNDAATVQFHVDGELVAADEAAVSVRDRGFRYGDAAFETMRAYGGGVFEFEAHRERLARACDRLAMPDALPGDLHGRIQETLAANDLRDAYVRAAVTRGVQPGSLTPREPVDPTVVVEVRPLPRGGTAGEPAWDEPLGLQTARTRRPPDDALPADVKTHNYLPSVLARAEVDAEDALMLDPDGNVACTAGANVFFVREDGLHTPHLDGPVLPGVTRRVVLDLAREEEVPVHEGQYGRDALLEAEEAFVTNTTAEVRPVAALDNVSVGGGPVTDLLAARFRQLVEDRHYANADEDRRRTGGDDGPGGDDGDDSHDSDDGDDSHDDDGPGRGGDGGDGPGGGDGENGRGDDSAGSGRRVGRNDPEPGD